jgi:hypothetical protein
MLLTSAPSFFGMTWCHRLWVPIWRRILLSVSLFFSLCFHLHLSMLSRTLIFIMFVCLVAESWVVWVMSRQLVYHVLVHNVRRKLVFSIFATIISAHLRSRPQSLPLHSFISASFCKCLWHSRLFSSLAIFSSFSCSFVVHSFVRLCFFSLFSDCDPYENFISMFY